MNQVLASVVLFCAALGTIKVISMIRLPFVSRARFEDREQRIRELKEELAELRHRYDRMLDPAVHVATGVHIHERFEKKPQNVATAEPTESAEPLNGLSEAINKVGTRPTAIRKFMEAKGHADYLADEQEAMNALPTKAVQAQIEKALVLGTERAKAPQA